jgi:3-hydroxyacyl-CoA dehydrogenase
MLKREESEVGRLSAEGWVAMMARSERSGERVPSNFPLSVRIDPFEGERVFAMEIQRVACVGAGLIGRGWATIFAAKGFDVILHDIDTAVLREAVRVIRENIAFLEESGFLKKGAVAPSCDRIETTTNLAEAIQAADYVQESVFDDYPIKKEVFKEMDAVAPESAILASSASGLLMTEIQRVTKRPERCVLVHPILPVHLIPVVEIVGGEKTSAGSVEAACALMRRLGKTPVLLKREVPGYIVNRLQAALLREAIDLVAKGVATVEDVDRAFCMGIGLRDPFLGPFMRIHLVANGVERFKERYAQSYHYRWSSMDTWTEIPPGAFEEIVAGTKAMEKARTKTVEEIMGWRDHMLVRLIKLLKEDGSNG